MQKKSEDDIITVEPIKKSNNNLILAIIIIILLLLVISVLAYLGYDYLKNKPPKVNETEQNESYINDTTPINESEINDTLKPRTSVCGNGKCEAKENYTNCPADCKKPGPGPGGDNPPPSCTPNCAGKQCGSNGCGGTCAPGCAAGYECNSTFNCSLIPCTNDTGCDKRDLLCQGNLPYNCTNTDLDICLERINLTACTSGWQCVNGSAAGCEEIKDCTAATAASNCSNLFNGCSYGICNSTGKCEIRYNSSVICRSAVGACGAAETCSGNSAACPADANSSGNICRASVGVCDVSDRCNGLTNSCPADIFNSSTTLCRNNISDCDTKEFCIGTANCPFDVNKSNGEICLGGTCQSGKCTPSSSCAGTDVSCGVFPACVNCNLQDGCNGNDNRNYYCSGTSCQFTPDSCTDCSCSCGGYNKIENSTNNNCNDGKDNNCDGKTDNADSGCSCIPNCVGKVCGDNGCGGSCGTCNAGYECNSTGQCVLSSGNVYYVDNSCSLNGNGLSQTCASTSGGNGPFNSLANAQSAVTGDKSDNKLLLKRGQIFSGQFTVKAFGTAGHDFYIGSYGTGANPIISGGSSNIYLGIYDTTKEISYVTIDGLTCVGQTYDRGAGIIAASGPHHITIKNCIVRDGSTFGIRMFEADYSTITNNSVYGFPRVCIMIEGFGGATLIKKTTGHIINENKAHNCSTGLYTIQTDNSLIYDNEFYHNGGPNTVGEEYGIGILACSNNSWYRNYIHNNYNSGVQFYGGDSSNDFGPSNDNLFYQNLIAETTLSRAGLHGIALTISSISSGQYATGNKVYYNIFKNNKLGLVLDCDVIQGENSAVYNNVFYKNDYGLLYDPYPNAAKNQGYVVKNNLFLENSVSDIDNYYGDNLEHSNNLFYRASGGTRVIFNKTNYDLTTVKTIFEPSAINIDPKLISSSDLHLQSSSPAIDAGINVGLTSDFEGNPIVGIPDIGAYEYQGIISVLACNDSIDNDGDGYIDMDDLGCTSPLSNDENINIRQCRTDFYSINGNIVLNPNMECDNNGDLKPDNWTLSGTASIDIKWKSSALGRNSKVMVGYKKGTALSNWDQHIQISRLKPNSWYEVSFDMAAEQTEPTLRVTSDISNNNTLDESSFWNGLIFIARDRTNSSYSSNYSIDESYWIYGPAYADWSDAQGIYYQAETRATEPWRRVVGYVKTPPNFGTPEIYTLLYANTTFYVDNILIREVDYDLDAPKINAGKLEFIKYKGTDFFPIILEGDPYRTLPNGTTEQINRNEIKSLGFNTLYHEYRHDYHNNDPRFAEMVIFPTVYYNDYGLNDIWRHDPEHKYTYTGWNRFLSIYNASAPNLLFVRLFDEITYPPSKGMHIGYLKPDEKAYNYIKQTSNALVFSNFNGMYGDGAYTSNFDDFVNYYLPYTDAVSSTQNLPRAYPKGDSLPEIPDAGLATRKTTRQSTLAGDYKPVIAYGLGVYEWSSWDGIENCPAGNFKCNQYIPFNLQRYQVWDQIINGAVGATFWGLNNYCYLYVNRPSYVGMAAGSMDPKYCDYQFNQATTITKELASLYNVLLEPYYYDEWTVSNENIDVMMKKHNGKIYLLTTSTAFEDLYDVTLSLPNYTLTSVTAINEVNNGNIFNVFNRTVAIQSDGHSFKDNYIGEDSSAIQGKAAPGYAVHIYEIVAEEYRGSGNLIYAVDGTREGIQTAINLAKTRDTVVIPAGTWDVSGTINSYDGINIKGAGRELTILKKADANNNPMFSIKSNSGGSFEFSDLTLYGIGKTLFDQNPSSTVSDTGLYMWGKFNSFKIHNCLFTKFAYAGVRIVSEGATVNGQPKGVIYENSFIDNLYTSGGVSYGYGVTVKGNGSWEIKLGTDDAVFVENNYFERCRHSIAANNGARYVFRYNTVYNNYYPWSAVDAHGKSLYAHGTRSYEIYKNNISQGIEWNTLNPHPTWAAGIRGGDGVIFNNIFEGGNKNKISLSIEQYDTLSQYTYPVPDQTTDLWIWGNTLDGIANNSVYLGWNADTQPILAPYLQEGRDYHYTIKPGYTPYTYPHPLRQQALQPTMQLQSEQASPLSLSSQIWSFIRSIFTGNTIREITGYFLR